MIYKIISNIFVGKAPMKQIYIMVLHKNWFAILSFVQKLFNDFKYLFSFNYHKGLNSHRIIVLACFCSIIKCSKLPIVQLWYL